MFYLGVTKIVRLSLILINEKWALNSIIRVANLVEIGARGRRLFFIYVVL